MTADEIQQKKNRFKGIKENRRRGRNGKFKESRCIICKYSVCKCIYNAGVAVISVVGQL